MTAVGCGTVEVNPPQHSIKQREKCGPGALGRGAAGPVFLHVGTAFVEPTDGHTYDPTDGATTDPYPAVPACPWVATDDPSVLACAMAAVLKRAKAVANPIVVSFMVVAFLVV